MKITVAHLIILHSLPDQTPISFPTLYRRFHTNNRVVSYTPKVLRQLVRRMTPWGVIAKRPDPDQKTRMLLRRTEKGRILLEWCLLKIGPQHLMHSSAVPLESENNVLDCSLPIVTDADWQYFHGLIRETLEDFIDIFADWSTYTSQKHQEFLTTMVHALYRTSRKFLEKYIEINS